MAMHQSALLELLDLLKGAEAEGVIEAGFWERTEGRTAIRNGSG